MEHRHDNPVASFERARVNMSIVYVTMGKLKAPINILSRSEAPKTQIAIMDMREKKQWTFFHGTARASTLATAIILPSWVPVQKFLFLFKLQFLVHIQYRPMLRRLHISHM